MLQGVPHQMVQSPARLGLSNPNSPALPSPTASKLSSQTTLAPPSHPPPPPKPTTTSSTLLSLLPPLPRAQALLLQMASLTSKLFDISPHRSLWLSSFHGSLPTFLPPQSHSSGLPSLDSSPSSTKEVLALSASLQAQLFDAIAELQEILNLQDAKQKLTRAIEAKDSAILAFAKKLQEAERVLDILVDDYADYRRPKRHKPEDETEESSSTTSTTTVASQLKLSDILTYAHRISYTTFAPPEFGAGVAPLRGALPPAPQEEQMRASQLYAYANLDVGLPKAAEDKDRAIEPLIEMPQDGTMPGFLPPGIMVPAGWKPGMPVELPRDLPLPPPGWKPGDPVPLPQLESLPKAEEVQMRPVGAGVVPKAAEPIQVPHVQLDILDQDDDSSDYSSDEGSSDDED